MAAGNPQYTESNIIGSLNSGITASTPTITASFFDKITGAARTPQTNIRLWVIDKGSEGFPNANYEIIYTPDVPTTTSGVTTFTSCVRGLLFYGTSLGAGTGKAHNEGATLGTVDLHYLFNLLTEILDGSKSPTGFKLSTRLGYELAGIVGARSFADATARDTAITAPSAGDFVYLVSTGTAWLYLAGAWTEVGSVSTPNASETAAGKVQVATTAESIAGTNTGTTGALLVPHPSDIGKNVQNNAHIYGASAVGSDSYAITVTPAPAAYAAGQKFTFKADVANTGAATLQVNALAAIAIKKDVSSALSTNDILAGQIVEVEYDGTNFQLSTPATGTKEHLRFNNAFTWDLASDKVIAHGLGVAPTWIRASSNLVGAGGGSIPIISHGSKNGATYSCRYTGNAYTGGGSVYEDGVKTDCIAFLKNLASTFATITVTMDATNVTFQRGDSDIGDVLFEFECGI